MNRPRIAVVGTGSFGRNHVRVLRNTETTELAGIMDTNGSRAAAIAAEFGCQVFSELQDLQGKADAAIVAVPTFAHAEVALQLFELGIDVLVEKPISNDLDSAEMLVEGAQKRGRILQVGHLERFNPAVIGLKKVITLPLFFEVHRLSLFSPRSLDVDVVLDLMIHDLDIVLDLVGEEPQEIRAAGLSILSDRVDIANVRLAFPGGCVANLTASRVSTERVRKLRLFQPHQYISLDYQRQDGAVFSVSKDRQIGFTALVTEKQEPLVLELETFARSVATRKPGGVSGAEATRALRCALSILDKIKEHTEVVSKRLEALR